MIINIPGIIPSKIDFNTSLPIGLSVLGTPIFDDVTFPKGLYFDNDSNEINYAEIKLQTVKVTVTQAKKIVNNYIAGRDGSVKEFISMDDYTINVSGKINELTPLMPADQLIELSKVKNAPNSIPVICKFLNVCFNIHDVIITSLTVNTIQGCMNEVDFSMDMVSDAPFDVNNFIIS